MNRRPRLSSSWQTLLAAGAGLAVAAWVGTVYHDPTPLPMFGRCLAATGASLFNIWTRALAGPLILTSLILGAVGLEPMRAVVKLTRRTLTWMALSTALAVLTGAAAAFIFTPARGEWDGFSAVFSQVQNPRFERQAALPWGWAALVLFGLGFAYYRNQIEEGHGRLLVRLCQSVEETLAPLLDWTLRLAPWGVLLMVLAEPVLPQRGNGELKPEVFGNEYAVLWFLVKAVLAGWFLFAVVLLPAVLWALTRISPWRFLWTLLPAALVAFGSGELEPALPLTLHTARQRLHVSNRVAGVVVSLATAFQREGLALGFVAIAFCRWRMGPATDWQVPLGTLAAGWLLGVTSRLASTRDGSMAVYLLLGPGLLHEGVFVTLLLARFVGMGRRSAVLSQGCAAAIIARGEGEYWVPGPPPDADELQGLKSGLDTAEG